MNYKGYKPRKLTRQNSSENRICSKCKKEKPLRCFYYHRSRRVYMSSCTECNSNRIVKYYQDNRRSPKVVFQLRSAHVRRTAKINKIPFDKSGLGKHLLELWQKGKGICFYTGLQMSLTGYHTNPMAVTVDRLIPKNGYVKGNIILCCSIVNRMKQNLTYNELLSMCKTLLSHKKNVKKSLTILKNSVNVVA